MEYPHYSVDGVPLNDPAGRWFVDGGSMELPELAGARAVSVAVPGRHGTIPVAPLELEPTTLGCSLVVTDRTPGGDPGGSRQLQTNYETVKSLVGQRRRLAVLGYHLDPGTTRTAEAIVISASTAELLSTTTLRLAVLWQIPGVFWRDQHLTTWETGLPLIDSTPVATLDGSTAPITDALIRITGPADRPWVLDWATGGELSFDGLVDSGEWLLLDCGRMRATLTAMDTWDLDAGTDVTGMVATRGPGSGTRWLHLTPVMVGGDPDTRRVEVTAGATSQSGAVLEIRARRAYL